MLSIKNPDDPIVRETLWKVYNKRCFYCKDPLQYKNMQIDHLIPKTMGEDKAIIEYGLNNGFKLNSYNNLVPSCASCNNIKRAKTYEKTRMLYLLEDIESNISKLEKFESYIRKQDSDSGLLNSIEKVISEDRVYDLIKLLNENDLTSVEHYTLNETLKNICPVSTLTPLENRKIQKFIDEVNNLLIEFNRLGSFFNKIRDKFVSKRAGIVITDEFKGPITYSLFPVSIEEKNIIKQIDIKQWYFLASRGVFKSRTTVSKNSFLHSPTHAARRHIFSYFANLLSINALYKSKNELIATEFIFDFIDNYRYQLGLQIKEEYEIDNLIKSIQIHLPLWIDEALKSVDKTIIDRLVQSRGYVRLDFINFLISSYREKVESRVYKRMEHDNKVLNLSQYTSRLPIITEQLPFHAFQEFVFNFKNNNIKQIKRIYKLPNWERKEFIKSSRIYDAYSENDILKNIRFVYENVVRVYNDVVDKVFPRIRNDLIPFIDCSKIIVEIEKVKDNYEKFPPYSYNAYFLKDEENYDEFELIFYEHTTDLITQELRKSRNLINKQIKFNNKNYRIQQISSGILDFVYHKLPLFINVKKLLDNKFKKLLDEDYKNLILKLT